MDFGRAMTYMFQDKDWVKKILIGGAFMLVPWIGPLFILGYAIQVIRNVHQGIDHPLPEWDNWEKRLIDGLMIFVLIYLYMIPVLAMIFIPCIGWICIIPYMVTYLPIPMMLYAKHGKIEDALNFREAWRLYKKNFGSLLLLFLMTLGIQLISFLGILACCIGMLFTGFWANLAHANLVGQLYRQNNPPMSNPSV